jgi:hypothetical protein
MPQVGDVHFPYTKEGEQDADKMAQRTGQRVQHAASYATGGPVETTPSGCTVVSGYSYPTVTSKK